MNKTLQGLRFVFVAMIMMSHFEYGGLAPYDAGGDCGVAFFMVLSGFLMSMGYGHSIDDGEFVYGNYLLRRLLRIYPLHLLCLVVFLVLFRPAVGRPLVLNALLLQSWVPQSGYYFSYNGVSWFLSTLLFSYLLFPLVYRRAGWKTLGILMLAYVAVCLLVPYERVNALLYVSPPVRFVDFFLGIVLYKVWSKSERRPLPQWVEPVLVVALIAALMAYPILDAKLRNAPLYWAVLVPVIYVFSREEGPVSRFVLRLPVMQWLGGLSLPIFMLHPMVFRLLFEMFPSMSATAMLALCFSVTIAFSYVVKRLIINY